ncbi:hypothetical protein PIB30_070134 [Stylosanthes scabra]|uniref:Uncharacterized protein n=1 Tax=Stylosanthes scabra TaxID=79078 RepID=A0ABU6UNC5_9FABA|nr:hypothetical protein [Stylosanthes scabra]
MLSGCHDLRPFHRFRSDRRFPSLSLKELIQGGLYLLHIQVWGIHPLQRGILGYLVLPNVLVIEWNVHHLRFGGSTFRLPTRFQSLVPTDGANVKHRCTEQ